MKIVVKAIIQLLKVLLSVKMLAVIPVVVVIVVSAAKMLFHNKLHYYSY